MVVYSFFIFYFCVCYICTLCKGFYIKFAQLDVANILGKIQMSNNSVMKKHCYTYKYWRLFSIAKKLKGPKCPIVIVWLKISQCIHSASTIKYTSQSDWETVEMLNVVHAIVQSWVKGLNTPFCKFILHTSSPDEAGILFICLQTCEVSGHYWW